MTLNFYKVHQFTTVGNSTFVVSNSPEGSEIEYLIVAGGGGAGNSNGCSGGGAGGYLSSVSGELSGANSAAQNKFVPSAQSYAVVVGAGGVGSSNQSLRGGDGGNSSIFGFTAIGGGGGGSEGTGAIRRGNTGGSGGGSVRSTEPGGLGTAGQGLAGGANVNDGAPHYSGGGGGGAGAVGQNGTAAGFGAGGRGIRSSITGTPTYRAGGGGAGWYNNGNFFAIAAPGGLGGGGNGGHSPIPTAGATGRDGAPNTGGGGGGHGIIGSANKGGDGGSGIVIVRYPTATFKEPTGVIEATGGTISYIFDGLGVYKIHRFSTAGTYSFQVTNVGLFNQKIKFAAKPGSTFNGASGSLGVLTPEESSYSVVVAAGGFVDVAYPMNSLPNTIPAKKFASGFIPIQATGGAESTITVDGKSYKLHQFTTVGNSNFVVTDPGTDSSVEYLVIAGGGGGGNERGGAGGAGGYRSNVPGQLSGGASPAEPRFEVVAKSYPVTVGAGGLGFASYSPKGEDGGVSIFGSIVSRGGGGGGTFGDFNARPGGSGSSSRAGAAEVTRGLGTLGQGFRGGDSSPGGANANGTSGGGGGAGGQGNTARPTSDGGGGIGLSSNITGTAVTRASGGGGGASQTTQGFAPTGGGGNGGRNNLLAQNGQANTGGGGGGGGGQAGEAGGKGGNGGSGVVIVRYPLEPIN